MDNLDQANQEIEKLNKQIDKLQAEFTGKSLASGQYLLRILIFVMARYDLVLSN